MVEEALKIKHLPETITLVCMRVKGEKSSYEPTAHRPGWSLLRFQIAGRDKEYFCPLSPHPPPPLHPLQNGMLVYRRAGLSPPLRFSVPIHTLEWREELRE